MGNSSSEYTTSWALIGASNQAHTQGLQTSTEYFQMQIIPQSCTTDIHHPLLHAHCTQPPANLRRAEIGVYTGQGLLLSGSSAAPEVAGIGAGKN